MGARRTYNRLWRKADRFYGQEGAPPPVVNWLTKADGKPNADFIMWVDPGTREVSVTPGQRRALAAPKKKYQGGKLAAQKRLLHEWAHVFQSPEVFDNPDPTIREFGASQLARRGAKQILRPKGRRKTPRPRPWIDSGQFGSTTPRSARRR